MLIFLRRQDYIVESRFAQSVKVTYEGDIRDLQRAHFEDDHDRRMLQLEEIFGRDNLRLGLYRDGEPNDVLGSFLEMLGLADLELERAITPQNISMHRRKLLFLSQVPKADRRAAGFISRVVEASSAIDADGGRFVLPPAARRDLVAQYQDANRAIVARYGIADAGRFLDLPDPAETWAPMAPITRGEIAGVFRDALRACPDGRNPLAAAAMALRVTRLFGAMGLRSAGWRRRGRPSTSAPPPDQAPHLL